MRFMVIVKATPDSEAGVMPTPESFERMEVYNAELTAAGVLLDAAGLRNSSHGVRVNFDGETPMVTDGPFTETKELVAGFWIWECRDLQDAIAWVRKAPFDDGTLEIRPFFTPEDFAGVASDALIAQEEARLAQDTADRQERLKGAAG